MDINHDDLLCIARYLSIRDLVHLMQTCRNLRDMIGKGNTLPTMASAVVCFEKCDAVLVLFDVITVCFVGCNIEPYRYRI